MTAIALDAIGTQPVRIPPVAEEWQAEILRYAATLPALRPEPPMTKGNKRYDLPHPTTGEKVPRGYGRVSNLASSLDDPYGIHQWEQGLLIEGMLADATLPAAYRTISEAFYADDALTMQEAIEDNPLTAGKGARGALAALRTHAMWAAGRDLKADVGTAFHTIAEHRDAGRILPADPPDRAVGALDAYCTALGDHGIEIIGDLIETCVVNPAVGVAGRADRFVRVPGVEHPVVADLKTGSLREVQHAIQLACYAHATHRWTPDGYEPMPAVDHDLGLVIAVDLEQGTCTIHALNIAEGWRRAQIAAEARKANTEPKAVRATMPERPTSASGSDSPDRIGEGVVSHGGSDAVNAASSPQIAHLAERIRTIAADDRLAPQLYARFNAQGLTGPAEAHTWTDTDVAAIEAIAVELEGIAPAPGEPPIGFQGLPVVAREAAQCAVCTAPMDDGVCPSCGSAHDPEPAHPRAWDVADDGTPADPMLATAAAAAMAALDVERQHWGYGWAGQAQRAGKAWGVDLRTATQRIAAINHAAVACLTHLWEDDEGLDPRAQAALRDRATRHALGIVLGDDLQPTWATGTTLGVLTVDQALALAQLAEGFGRGDEAAIDQFAPLYAAPTPPTPPEAA